MRCIATGRDDVAAPLLHSVITCPHCGHRAEEQMPTDACQWYYECRGCGVLLRPKPGDCCVFCSYGTVPCPPVQADGACCHRPSA
jgi:hypothetical protein